MSQKKFVIKLNIIPKTNKSSTCWSKQNIYIVRPNKDLRTLIYMRDWTDYILVCYAYTPTNLIHHP